jgi:uncharacterized membrane protein
MRFSLHAGSAQTRFRLKEMKGTNMAEANQTGISDNGAGALAYVTVVPAIVFLFLPPYNASPYVRFHAWQSIFLNIVGFVSMVALSVVLGFSFMFVGLWILAVTRIIWLLWILLWIVCAVNALNGKMLKLPLIGALAEKQAAR